MKATASPAITFKALQNAQDSHVNKIKKWTVMDER